MDSENLKSFGEVLGDAANNLGEIVRSEFQLAKLELRQAAAKSVAPLRDTIVGAVLALYALGFLLLAVLFLLRIVMPEWLAALIVFAMAGIAGGAMIGKGVHGFQRMSVPLERTAINLKEQVRWVKQQTR